VNVVPCQNNAGDFMSVYTKCRLGENYYIQNIKIYILGLAVALSLPSVAMANDWTKFASYISTFAGSEATEDISSPSRYPRFSKQAKEDAAAFVASDGAIRGPFLESAIREFRIIGSPHFSDRDIANLILGGS
jgi:uncharacterized protein (TIGR02448 family)